MEFKNAGLTEGLEGEFSVGFTGVLGNWFTEVLTFEIEDVTNPSAIAQRTLSGEEIFAGGIVQESQDTNCCLVRHVSAREAGNLFEDISDAVELDAMLWGHGIGSA